MTVTLRALRTDLRRRIENFRVCLLGRRGSKELRLRHDYRLRTYTARQFRSCSVRFRRWNCATPTIFRYDIEQPFPLNDEMGYCLFVLGRRLPW